MTKDEKLSELRMLKKIKYITLLLITNESTDFSESLNISLELILILMKNSFFFNIYISENNFSKRQIPPPRDISPLKRKGARYLDPKYSRWISVDPALGEYIPGAGKSDEADKLPGMGGLFNTVNLSLFHYAGNNPVRYIDPDGRIQRKKDGSVTFFPYSDEPILELGNSDLILLFHWGDIKANDGTNIKVRYNLSDYRPENSNCHGFTFTNGLVWIQPDQVQALLDGDGYNELQKPEAGGIFVQYDDAGMAWHSGKILSVNTTENIIEVIEAMGVTVFKRTDGKLYDTRVHKYRIDEMGTVKFFKNEGDKIVED